MSAPHDPTCPGLAFYAYAVVPPGAALPDTDETIHPGAPLERIEQDGIAAVISRIPPDALGSIETEAEAARRALAHHAVNAGLSAIGPTLPLAFGGLFSTEAGLREFLRQRAPRLRSGLDRVAGSAEWTVALVEDEPAHLDWLERNDPGLAALASAMSQAQPGTAYLLARKRDRRRLTARTDRRAQLAERIASLLARSARSIDRREDPTLIRLTALLPAPEAERLGTTLLGMEGELAASGFQLSISGPWPAYAFAREVDRG